MQGKILLATLVALALVFGVGNPAFSSFIGDDYWGATPVNISNQDVIGADEHFNITGMDVTLTNSNFNAKIYSNYFDSASYGIYGTQIGDLFVSTDGWTPSGSAPYEYDNYYNGESWEIAIVLSGKPKKFSDNYTDDAFIYEVKDSENGGGSIVLTPQPSPSSWGAYRKDQELWYLPGQEQEALYTGTWTLHEGYLEIAFTFDPQINDLPDVTGYHWTYSCANDVIEGSVPVPPSLLLLGTGLVGMVGFRRKWGSDNNQS